MTAFLYQTRRVIIGIFSSGEAEAGLVDFILAKNFLVRRDPALAVQSVGAGYSPCYNKPMIHKLYSAYNLPVDHDVCHLFEHLVIRRFLRAVEKSGKLDEMLGLGKELSRM